MNRVGWGHGLERIGAGVKCHNRFMHKRKPVAAFMAFWYFEIQSGETARGAAPMCSACARRFAAKHRLKLDFNNRAGG